MLPRIILIILAALAPVGRSLAAPAGWVTLKPEDFDRGKYTRSLEQSWLYHPGDDPAWASSDYNDSAWTSRPTAYLPEDVAQGKQAQLCWYRLHLEVDSTLIQAGLYMTYDVQGALEIFVDGSPVAGIGKIGTTADPQETYLFRNLEPVQLPLRTGSSHLLAVRFSNHSSQSIVRMSMQPGFRIYLLAGEPAAAAMSRDRDTRVIGWSLIGGLGVALTLLHLVMFFSYRRGRENLYFAAFAASFMCFALLLIHGWLTSGWSLPEAERFFTAFRLLIVAMSLTGMWFMQSVRGMKVRGGDTMFGLMLAAAWLISWLTNIQVAYIISLVACSELIRNLWIAMRMRMERIWIIGLGFAALVPMVMQQLALEFGWIKPQLWHEYPPMLVLMAMALSMSAYLGSRFAKINRDLEGKIVEAKKTQEALAESEARYRSMFENTLAGVGILDDQGKAIFVNDRWVEILGMQPEDVLGHDARNQVAPQYLEEINRRLARLYRGEASRDTYEFEIVRTDGNTRTVQVWATPYRTETGVVHIVLHSMDVTETREAERMQREAIQLAEKTARMASIGVMAGGITHEINQPLNAIMLHAETLQFMAKAGKLDQTVPVNTALEHIIKSTERISDIIQHMRSFWVTPATAASELVDLNNPMRQGLLLLEQRVRSHAIRLKLEVDPGPLWVKADPLQVEQIVVNLISNAINALDKISRGDKEIFVRTCRDDDTVMLEVRDNGIGLPPDDLDKIFDPFYSTDKEAGGTGLGLAIVQMFVEKFKGTVQAQNNPEGGACFRVRLPQGGDPTEAQG